MAHLSARMVLPLVEDIQPGVATSMAKALV
jgi:hypothetical protein